MSSEYGTEGQVTGADPAEGQSLTVAAPPSYQPTPVYSAAAPLVQPQAAPLGQGQPMYAQPVGQPVYATGPSPVVYGTPSQQPSVVYAQSGGVQFVDQSGRTVIVQSAPAMPLPVQYGMSGPCGCSLSCCSGYLTYTLLSMLVLAWIGAIVCWNSSLHEIDVDNTPGKIQFFSTKYVSTLYGGAATTVSYSSLHSGDTFYSCYGGGIATIILAVFAFILLSLSIILIFYRISRVNGSYWFGSRNNRPPINVDELRLISAKETTSVALSFFIYVAISIAWGATCVNEASNFIRNSYPNGNASVPFTGYGYFIFCVILMVASLVHSLVIRQNVYYQTLGRVIPGMPQYAGQVVQQQQMVVLAQPQQVYQ